MSTKLIMFDLDGVLIDSKEIHFNALNLALDKFGSDLIITRKEQDNIFEGLTTKAKLDILTKIKGLPEELHGNVWALKQQYTSKLFESISSDQDLINLFRMIQLNGIKIAVASNSIRKTLDTCLTSLGVIDYIDYSLSNEDVLLPKPDAEIYNKCMEYFSIDKADSVIFEDSDIGLRAAYASGAKVEVVQSRKDITFERIGRIINEA